MSYQVLARKWRSQSFQDLVGQEHISQTLINALKANRFPHALLFSGTRGVGKTSSARILAKTLICPNAIEYTPCNQCTACMDITNGSHMDVIEIDGASNNGVDAIRELRETVGYTPSNGKYKIYIIDEVHMLSTSAFNALLKTLEEPPSHVVFIMATTEPQKIPITILSRCQRFDFRRISAKLIQEHIHTICKTENITFETEALWTIARLADGSMRDGLSLLDQAINFTNANLTQNNIESVLGATDRTLLSQTVDALLQRDPQLAIQSIESLLQKGVDPVVFSESLLQEIRNISVVKASEKPQEILDFSDSEIENLKVQAQKISSEDLHLLFDMALKGTQDLLRSQSPQIVLEMLILRMSQAPKVTEIQSFVQDIGHSTTKTPSPSPQKAKVPPPAPAPTAQESYSEKKSLFENWQSFVKQIKTLGPILAAQLEHSALIELTSEKAVLSIAEKDKFFFEQLKESKQILKVKEAFKRIWNMDLKIEVSLQKEEVLSPKEIEKQELKKSENKLLQDVEAHPLIQSLKKTFEGDVVEII